MSNLSNDLLQADRVGIFAPLMSAQTDIELFDNLSKGDVRAYELVFRKYYQALVNYAFTFVKNKEDAEEVVQFVFVNVWHKKESIHIQSSLQAYLYRAVNNNCLNKIRHLKVREAHKNEIEYNTEAYYEHSAQELISKELQKKIRITLENLPDRCREVFELSRFEGMSYAEIAEALGVSVKAVEKQMSKALKTLRFELAEYLPLILLFLGEECLKL